jgi:hypothetical protein
MNVLDWLPMALLKKVTLAVPNHVIRYPSFMSQTLPGKKDAEDFMADWKGTSALV